MTLDRRFERFAGWGLMAGGALYWLFYGSTVGGFGLGDDYWMLTLAVHALSIVAIMLGLIGARAAFSLDGWGSTVWWVATALAFLGLTVANVFFAWAAFGLAVVAFVSLRHPGTAGLLVVGGGLWLYLYLVGVRVGDQNARPRTETEELIGLIATILLALGLIGLGWAAMRLIPAGSTDSPPTTDVRR